MAVISGIGNVLLTILKWILKIVLGILRLVLEVAKIFLLLLNLVFYQDICYPVTKEFREKLYSEIERAYAEAKEKQQEQAKEQSQKQGKEQSQDKDGFMKASGEPLPFR